MTRRCKSFLGVLALLAAGSTQAASISFDPGDILIPPTGQFTVNLILDLGGIASQGGGAEFEFTGGVTFVSFTPSAYFNSFDTNPNGVNDFTRYGAAGSGNAFEITLAALDGIGSGTNSLGTMAINVYGPGGIRSFASPVWDTFIDLELGTAIPGFIFGGLQADVPLPATAWLFLAGLGAAATRLRRRA
jgi:hypothetical protein